MTSFKQFYEAAVTPPGNYMSINVDGSIVLPGYVPPVSGNSVPSDKQHVTLIYSKTSSIDPNELLTRVDLKFPREITAQVYEFAAFDDLPKDGERDENKATLVVKLKSEFLTSIHEFLKSQGCSHTYPEYSAHVSLQYGVDRAECHTLVKVLNRIVKLPTDIRLSGYKSDRIIEDWADKMNEAKVKDLKETPARQVSGGELRQILGKGKMNAIAKHPWMHEIGNYEHAYKYGVGVAGFEYVEIYAFMRSIHTTADGKIRPELMLKFTLSYTGYSVIQVDKYYRAREPDEMEKKYGSSAGWRPAKQWRKS